MFYIVRVINNICNIKKYKNKVVIYEQKQEKKIFGSVEIKVRY